MKQKQNYYLFMIITVSAFFSMAFNGQNSIIEKSKVIKTWQLVNVLGKEKAPLWDVSFSPDGKKLIVACFDHNAYVYDIQKKEKVIILDSHSTTLNCSEYSPDGSLILTSDNDDNAFLWDSHSGKHIYNLIGSESHFSHDGSYVFSETNEVLPKLLIWDAKSGKNLSKKSITEKILIKLGIIKDKHGKILNMLDWLKEDRVDDEVFDNPYLVSVLYESTGKRTLHVWQKETRKVIGTINITDKELLLYDLVLLTKDAQYLAILYNGTLNIWQVNDGNFIRNLGDSISRYSFSPNSKYIAAITEYKKGNHGICVYDLKSCELVTLISASHGIINDIAWSPDSNQIAAITAKGYILLHCCPK